MNTLILLLLILIVINNNFKTRLGLVIFLVIISYLENIRNNYYKEDFTESNIDFVNNMILKNKELKSGINECMTDKEYKFFLNKIKCLSNNSRVHLINRSGNGTDRSGFNFQKGQGRSWVAARVPRGGGGPSFRNCRRTLTPRPSARRPPPRGQPLQGWSS